MRNKSHKENRRWASCFDEQIEIILSELGHVEQATAHEDKAEATDLWLTRDTDGRRLRVGVRVQTQRYKHYFSPTISTSKRYGPNGSSEFDTIINKGLGDLLFYGVATDDEEALDIWVLVHMPMLRRLVRLHGVEAVFGREKDNGRDTHFRAVSYQKLQQHGCIRWASTGWPQQKEIAA